MAYNQFLAQFTGDVFRFGTINSIIGCSGEVHLYNDVGDMTFGAGSSYCFGSLEFVADKLGRLSLVEDESAELFETNPDSDSTAELLHTELYSNSVDKGCVGSEMFFAPHDSLESDSKKFQGLGHSGSGYPTHLIGFMTSSSESYGGSEDSVCSPSESAASSPLGFPRFLEFLWKDRQ